jgi:AraC family transcriptional regulator
VEWITFYSNGGKIMDVTIKTLPPRLVVSLRHLGPYFEVGPTWEKLCAWAGSKGLISPNTMFFGISYDDPDSTPPAEIRYDACIVVDKPVPVEGDFQLQEVAGGEYAVGLHIGPYDGLKDAYAYLYGQWIPAQKREIRDAPPYEVCLNDPGVTPPEELKTEICIPLA